MSAGVPTTFGVCRRLLVRRRPLVQGAVVQLDAATGQIEHRFNVVPDGCVGGSVWGSPTIDATDGSLYVATGNHGTCNTDEPFTEAVIKLSAADLSPIDAWRVPRSEQVFDSDFGSTPTVFDGTIAPGGSMRPLVGANKNGTFYVFDRGSLAPGPVARLQIADPGSDPEDGDGSIAPSAFDGKLLYVAGGSIRRDDVRRKRSRGTRTISASRSGSMALRMGPSWAP